MLNPNSKIAKSTGIDLPVMYVYLAGRIAGNCIEKCMGWRQDIVNHYKNYKVEKSICTTCDGKGKVLGAQVQYKPCKTCKGSGFTEEIFSYPIAFLDPLNSGEANSVDKQGLTSSIPPNLIYDKDLLSIERADIIVANVEDYFEVGIEEEMTFNPEETILLGVDKEDFYKKAFLKLQAKIRTRRENFGTICEIAWALYLKKPLILICPEARKEIYIKHPFAKRASVIVTSTEQLLQEKWLNILYKSVSGATY